MVSDCRHENCSKVNIRYAITLEVVACSGLFRFAPGPSRVSLKSRSASSYNSGIYGAVGALLSRRWLSDSRSSASSLVAQSFNDRLLIQLTSIHGDVAAISWTTSPKSELSCHSAKMFSAIALGYSGAKPQVCCTAAAPNRHQINAKGSVFATMPLRHVNVKSVQTG